jgi:uncharacterized repeat protein (TIGR01451 family)
MLTLQRSTGRIATLQSAKNRLYRFTQSCLAVLSLAVLGLAQPALAQQYEADLKIPKLAAAPNKLDENQLFELTIEAQADGVKSGDKIVNDVYVDLSLPPELVFHSLVSASAGSFDSATNRWSIGDMPEGPPGKGILVLEIRTALGSGGKKYPVSATVSSNDPDYIEQPGKEGDNTRTAEVEVLGADFIITKEVDKNTADEGELLTYTITIKNDGPADATAAVVTDKLPSSVSYQSDDSGGSYNPVSGDWSVGALDQGASAELEIIASINMGTTGKAIFNTATMGDSIPADGNTGNNSASVETDVNAPDLEVTKTVDGGPYNEGDTITYTIDVENIGTGGATGVDVVDFIQSGLTFVSADTGGNGSYNENTGLWVIGAIPNGDKVSLDITVTIDSGTAAQVINNTARVIKLNENDSNTLNNVDSIGIAIDGADLAVDKIASTPVANEGETVFFTISVTNNGPKDAKDLVLIDQTPTGFTYVNHVASKGNYNETTGTWDNFDLRANDPAETLELEYTVNSGTEGSVLVNTVAIDSADQPDSITDNNTASAPIAIGATDLAVTKTADKALVAVNENIVYTVTVTNNGPAAATAMQLIDLLPPEVSFINAAFATTGIGSAGNYDDSTGVWDLDDTILAVGASATMTLTVKTNADAAGSQIINTATLNAPQDPNPDTLNNNNEDSATVNVSGADIAITKNIGVIPTASASTPVSFLITATNNGPDDATDVEVTDKLPQGMDYQEHTGDGIYDPSSGIWAVGDLANGETKVLTISAIVAITATNVATVTNSSEPDGVTSNNRAEVQVSGVTTFDAGSCIIDMGVGVEQTPGSEVFQGYATGLEPYGLVYELIHTYLVPVYWSINPNKRAFTPEPVAGSPGYSDTQWIADARDFSALVVTGQPGGGYSATSVQKNYYGGSFIIANDFITPEVQAALDTWNPNGGDRPQVDCSTRSFTAPIFNTITSFPNAVLDSANGQFIEDAFYQHSLVPEESFVIAQPSGLTACHDVFTLPHADPNNWSKENTDAVDEFINAGASMWAGCHAVSEFESEAQLQDFSGSSDGINDFNYLSNRGLVLYGDHGNGTPDDNNPDDYFYENDLYGANPFMQLVSSFDASLQGGSEEIYMPFPDPLRTVPGQLPTLEEDPLGRPGGWRDTTAVAVYDPDHPEATGDDAISPGAAGLVIWGRARGDDTLGWVLYEASHALDGGSEFQDTSAARVYGNLLLLVGIERRPQLNVEITADDLLPGESTDLTTTVELTAPNPDGTVTYIWSDTCGGTFSSTSDADVTWTAPADITETTQCTIRVIVEDSCARAALDTVVVTVGEPPDLDDLPDSYGTLRASGGAEFFITGGNQLVLGSGVSGEDDGFPGPAADGDTLDDGVSFLATTSTLGATVTGINATGNNAMLCGYVDGAADETVDGVFTRNLTYLSEVGLGAAAAGAGNEEICIQVDEAPTSILIAATANTPEASADCYGLDAAGQFTCVLRWGLQSGSQINTYGRFILTTDDDAFTNKSPSPTGRFNSGEVEGYQIIVNPTTVTMGDIDLTGESLESVIQMLALAEMDRKQLVGLLARWSPGHALLSVDAGADALRLALRDFLDPDGDGQVALVTWDTLEERGTIGFYLERQGADKQWQRINNDLLPGLVIAPTGGEYMLLDPAARSGELYRYRLIEQEADGNQRSYGPFNLKMD